MGLSDRSPPAVVVEQLLEVGRLRLSLPDGRLAGDVVPFWPDEFRGLWAFRLAAGGRGRVVVVLVEHDDIVPHAGLDRAAARLRKLALLERPPPHTTESLRPILDAVGGLSPATPDQPVESFATGPDGGVRLTFTEPAAWVWFAAAGGRGIPPAEIVGGSGVRAPVASGVMICDLRHDYRLSWTYLVDNVELARFSGHPDGPSPGADPGAGDPAPLVAERILGAARDALRRPFAVPAGPVRPLGAGPSGGGPGATVDGPSVDGGGPPVVRWAVAFLGGGSVVVDERDGVPCGTELIG